MPQQSLTEAELQLRLVARSFFQELVDSRTASLMERQDQEALAGWRQLRRAADRAFEALPAEAKQRAVEQFQALSPPEQSIRFAGALQEFAKDHGLSREYQTIDPQNARAAFQQILQEEDPTSQLATELAQRFDDQEKNLQEQLLQARKINTPEPTR